MKNSKGVTAVEYGLIGALISIVIMGGVTLTGVDTKEVFCVVASGMETALGGSGENCDAGGSDTGSSNQGITSKVQMDALQAATNNSIPSAAIPEEYGGTSVYKKVFAGSGGIVPISYKNGYVLQSDLDALEQLNSTDPVVAVLSLYDQNGNAITSYDDTVDVFNDVLQNNSDGVNYKVGENPYSQESYDLTVVTKSNQVYMFDVEYGSDGGGAPLLANVTKK